MGCISPTLAVRNMKQTIQFYRASLGFKIGMAFPDADNPEYADLSKDGMVIMLIPARNVGIHSKQKLGIGVNLYMQIDGDIDEYYKELKKKGVEIVVDIKDEPFGIRDFTVEDINGYKLTFNQVSKAVKACMSCGMPMNKLEDFGGGNPENLYCVYCSNPDGSLKSRKEVFEGMVNFMMMSQKMERETAESAAKERMSKMPAWSGRV
ncbi:MAG: zinc ribbon domain-containing protein [Dehalococcoidia bacterium]|nr:zinc ribbon domain-containing protein [Dehalococcoidia bacterium]